MKKIEVFEPWFFLFFGLFHLHRIWGLIDRDSYADFWLGVLENRGVFYYILMGILTVLCVFGIIVFFRNLTRNYWWRWIYLFGGCYLLFDLFAIGAGLNFWHELLLRMFDVSASYWNLIWGAFILLGAFLFCLGIFLIKERMKRRNG